VHPVYPGNGDGGVCGDVAMCLDLRLAGIFDHAVRRDASAEDIHRSIYLVTEPKPQWKHPLLFKRLTSRYCKLRVRCGVDVDVDVDVDVWAKELGPLGKVDPFVQQPSDPNSSAESRRRYEG
jgi:hypothetical protein